MAGFHQAGTPTLTDEIIAGVERRFAKHGHSPSQEHWSGLRAIAANIEDQASGSAEPKFYLCSLPTGMGKTTVVTEGLKALVSNPAYAEAGAVVFVNQLEQIPRLIDDSGLSKEQFAVRTGAQNQSLNNLGRSDHANAQVMFTTQQKLPHLLRHQTDFSEMSFFKFRDTPRRVRIWDEAILPAEPLTLTAAQIEEFAEYLAQLGQQRASALLETWLDDRLRNARSGSTVKMPPFILDLEWGVLDKLEDENDLLQRAFWMGSGDVSLYKDGFFGPTLIRYRASLPDQFAPLLILDASGSLRLTYQLWNKGRGNLVALDSPGKTYRNLTIHLWDQAAGKLAYQDEEKIETLANGTANAFAQIPGHEEVLIILRKQEDPEPQLEQRIRSRVAASGHDTSRLHFLTWGKHMASNEFAKVRHVIVIGALQYPYASNEALARASAALSAADPVLESDVEKVRQGEIKHHLFQAVGRGAVRKSVGGDCPEGCHLWIAASSKGPAPVTSDLLRETFPGARIERWEAVKAPLKKKEAEFVDVVVDCLGDRREIAVTLNNLAKHSKCSWNTAHRRFEEADVVDALHERGIEIEGPDKKSENGQVRITRIDRGKEPTSTLYWVFNKNLK